MRLKKRKVRFSIVIPTWNGKKLLKKNLPVVFKAVGRKTEIVVVDDGSTDGSQEYLINLEREEPNLKIIFHQKNLGFVQAVNRGVNKAQGEVVVLLNNDVVPTRGFLIPLEKDFADPYIFAVSLNEPQWSWAKGSWRKGFVEHRPGRKTKGHHLSFWASGGSGAFRKKVWDKLGGFDDLYSPFYWEDVDLSYRAWKRGYKIIWEPKSVVYHHHEGTISRFSREYVAFISQRNQLLFIWKNITSPGMILEHQFWLGKRLLTTPGFWRPFLAALVKWPEVFPRRLREWREQKLTDQEVFSQFD